ncbi:MAG: peptide-methionine (S)-S-oxide reductase, partial [Dolichospermum sp.]
MGIFGFGKKSAMPTPEQALAGRDEVMRVPALHYVNKNTLKAPFPQGLETAMFGLGCFWGAE